MMRGADLPEKPFTSSVPLCLGLPLGIPLHKNADVECIAIVFEQSFDLFGCDHQQGIPLKKKVGLAFCLMVLQHEVRSSLTMVSSQEQ